MTDPHPLPFTWRHAVELTLPNSLDDPKDFYGAYTLLLDWGRSRGLEFQRVVVKKDVDYGATSKMAMYFSGLKTKPTWRTKLDFDGRTYPDTLEGFEEYANDYMLRNPLIKETQQNG